MRTAPRAHHIHPDCRTPAVNTSSQFCIAEVGQVEVVIVHKGGRTEQLVLSPHHNFHKGCALTLLSLLGNKHLMPLPAPQAFSAPCTRHPALFTVTLQGDCAWSPRWRDANPCPHQLDIALPPKCLSSHIPRHTFFPAAPLHSRGASCAYPRAELCDSSCRPRHTRVADGRLQPLL
jgi:hypothetical protein